MAGRNKLKEISTLDTIPLSSTQTGTVTSAGVTVTGTGTAFIELARLGVILPGCTYLFSDDEKEVRKITSVSGSLQVLTIESPFSSDITADAFKITTPQFRIISISNSSGISGEVDGEVLGDQQTLTIDLSGTSSNSKLNLVDPFVVDGTVTPLQYVTRL